MNVTLQDLLERIDQQIAARHPVALCTIVDTRGSCPQSAGARMLLTEDGQTTGTLGGGCVEAEVRRRALEMLHARQSGLLEFSLDHDYGWDDGLICGGSMDVYVQFFSADDDRCAADLAMLQRALRGIRDGADGTLSIGYQKKGEPREFVDRIDPAPTLLIAGAGHVAQGLAQLTGPLGFRITVIDDRADYVSSERFPAVSQRIVGDIEAELGRFPVDRNTYVVIVTRGHQRDGRALGAVIASPARYIGMIGSKRKIKAIFDDLHQQGVPVDQLLRVHAPIGFDIGAVTVSEIAVSIAAELVAVRRGLEAAPAKPMKIDEQQIQAWLLRPAHEMKG